MSGTQGDGREGALEPHGSIESRYSLGPGPRTQGLVDVLDRILDKGLVIAGDIRINLADVELLTIQIRLLVCSIDKAEQIGMDWWKSNPELTASSAPDGSSMASLHEKLDAIENRLAAVERKKPKR